MINRSTLDTYVEDAGPAALVQRDELVPVEGPDGVIFPSTYASGDSFAGGYNIDGDPNGENVCLIDSVGSQANRIEPMFGRGPYVELVPQIHIRAGEQVVSVLEAGHRAGDAIVRCSPLQEELKGGVQSPPERRCRPAGQARSDVARFRGVGFPRHAGQGAKADRLDHSRVQRT